MELMITKSLLLERISPMALSRGLLFTLIMATNTRAFAEAPVRDLLSLSLEELMTLEVDTRQPYRNQVTGENLPLAMEVLDEELLQRLDAHSLQDALDYTGGVVRQNSFGNTWDSFAIRGFAGDENLPGGYFVNGFSAGRGFSGLRDLANIERIEVLKGAGAALYGRNEPGGTINLVT